MQIGRMSMLPIAAVIIATTTRSIRTITKMPTITVRMILKTNHKRQLLSHLTTMTPAPCISRHR